MNGGVKWMNIWPLWSQVGDQAEGIVSFKPVASVANVAVYMQKNAAAPP